jgi:hypothetical protein
MGTTQQTFREFGVHHYQLGDCLKDISSSSSEKLILVECPLCASDPTRPRYHFDDHESRPKHFEAHGRGEFGGTPTLTGRDA